ncbi:MAG TPA: hypothetical protein VKV74_01885 [Bryobacteraceae bacterium]|nr:hypothetical protein [Bryobacteraceae bacterium]
MSDDHQLGHAPIEDAYRASMEVLLKCRVCGCTGDRACEPPCARQNPSLCTRCSDVLVSLMQR